MRSTVIKVLLGAAMLGLVSGVAFAGSQHKDKDHNKTYMCVANDSGFTVEAVGKDGIVDPNFAYAGPTDKYGKPTEDGADWCSANVPVPPVVTPPAVPNPAPALAPVVLPDTGGSTLPR